ncbi:ATP-binding protein [Actinophytocola sp.]|uniref:ATP-binding protein n=1 Tax=Actinophytocola sp. TaxID=1872138 RepID=UPI002ED04591
MDIVGELIWNAIDAEATRVDVTIELDAFESTHEIVVTDDGHGMKHEDVPQYFQTHGDSWKKTTRFSPEIHRPLHGQLGRGRFLTYGIADTVEWRTVVQDGDSFVATVIRGSRSAPDEFDLSDPQPSNGPRGTTVRMSARQTSRAVYLVEGDVNGPLTARLAGSLLALPDVTVTYRGRALAPASHVIDQTDLEVPVPGDALHGKAAATLRVVEWDEDMGSKKLFLCDEHGGVVTEHKLTRLPPAPVHWSAYLLWEGFRDEELMSQADLVVPDMRHGELLDAAHRVLVSYLNQRLDERKGTIIAEWKSQGVYPYTGEPLTPTEEVEREVFDIVAVVASPAIGKDRQQKELSLRLLQEATRAEPTKTRRILSKVLTLSAEEQDVMVDLLERTTFGAIIRSAQTVADRADFVTGLRRLLYADETRKVFREVDQLHPMLVNEPWIFGDEWTFALSESGLTRVVKDIVTKSETTEFAPTPVKLPSGKQERVDLVFYRHLPESERNRNLVVELKRPMRVTMVEYGQLNNYVTAITGHRRIQCHPAQSCAVDRVAWKLRCQEEHRGARAACPARPQCRHQGLTSVAEQVVRSPVVQLDTWSVAQSSLAKDAFLGWVEPDFGSTDGFIARRPELDLPVGPLVTRNRVLSCGAGPDQVMLSSRAVCRRHRRRRCRPARFANRRHASWDSVVGQSVAW